MMESREMLKNRIAFLIEEAQNSAKSFSKTLDYTRKSVYDLDEILQSYHTDVRVSRPTENQLWSMAYVWGAYLGECLLRNGLAAKGYDWGEGRLPGSPVLTDGGGEVAPMDKVYKRLVNGRQDSVASFFDGILAMLAH